jgi:para-aminobenzoate synthetase/4-amino-4-deoxychorismate lyase
LQVALSGRLPGVHGDPSRGIFETALVRDGAPVMWGRHLARLRASALALYHADPVASLDLRVAEAVALGRLRVEVVPAGDSLAVTARCEPIDPAIVLPQAAPEVVSVAVSGGFGAHKLIDRGWLEAIEASVPAGARALLVAPGGGLLETTRANVFVVRRGALETPPLDGRILPGIIRAVVLERAREAGIAVREAPVALEDADAILLTGSVRLLECRRLRVDARSDEVVDTLRKALVE